MRYSKFFSSTLRDEPAGIDAVSHKLLLRAGYLRQVGAGLFAYLPLAKRSLRKLEQIIREELDAIGAQEISMPVVQPADLWQKTGRWQSIGPEMARFQDRKAHDMVLAMTHEELTTMLAAGEIKSYRQLPQTVYHFQTKFRDEARPRAGLIRVREFTMKDSYAPLDADAAGLDISYQAHARAYARIFERCELPVVGVAADVGMMGGSESREYMFATPIGEDTLFTCEGCGYAANSEIATCAAPAQPMEDLLPVERVATPATKTIDALATLLGIDAQQTAKAVFFVAERADAPARFVFAVLRGDRQLNELKLQRAVGATALRAATEAEILAIGAVPGYASPIGLNAATTDALQVVVVADTLVLRSANLVAGANVEGMHLRHTNCPRDYVPDIAADISQVVAANLCPACSTPLRETRGVEVAHIFKLGTRFSAMLGATYLDAAGQSLPIVMGSYGIGLGRLLACIAEAHNDAHGLVWPRAVAPFAVHLLLLSSKDGATEAAAERIYALLRAADIDVLFDDRVESPGVKFADADLIGCPVRLTVSVKSLGQGGVEFKQRRSSDKRIVAEDALLAALASAD